MTETQDEPDPKAPKPGAQSPAAPAAAPARAPKAPIERTPLVLITSTGEHRRRDPPRENFLSRRMEALALVLVVVVLVGTPAISFALKDAWMVPDQDPDGTFNMVGYLPEQGGWSIKNITVHLNDTVRIRVWSADTSHGLGIARFGVDSGPVEYGKPVIVTFQATALGDFSITCTVPCSPEHSTMVATLHVVA